MIQTLDLFSGIGGFSLGLEATGHFHTRAFVEIKPFCQSVLKKHWPNVSIYSDIKTISIKPNTFDCICGGFPCQDISRANCNGQSLLGSRSGLWFEFYRLIMEGNPEWVIIENVEALRNKGLCTILSQLADIGYDAEWHVIPAYSVGLPHTRKRLFIIAHSVRHRVEGVSPFPLSWVGRIPRAESVREIEDFLQRWNSCDATLLRSSHGIPDYVDRIEALGNSVVPAIIYEIGLSIGETL